MAVQGKLVPQDPNDEPASVLLERIRSEKEQLIKEGKIKKEKNPSRIFRGADNLPYEQVGKKEPVCIADEVPFEIPESWEWVRLGEVGITNIGLTYKPSDKIDNCNGTPVLRSNNIQDGKIELNDMVYVSCNVPERAVIEQGDILICARNGSRKLVGKSAIIETGQFAFGAFMAKYTSHLCKILNPYILLFLESPIFRSQLDGVKTETINQITQDTLKKQLLPLPPLKEQQRIVSKLNELQPYIIKYKSSEENLSLLNSSFPDSLKKSILQWAVQGKLVPQDPNDEPASVLLERIRSEKEQLIRDGKIKRDKHESVIYRRDNSHYEKCDGVERCIDDEIPFEIPDSWKWVRLGTVSTYAQTKKKINAQQAPKDIWGLDLEDIDRGGAILSVKTVGERSSKGDKTFFKKNDVLYSKLRPYLLKILVAPDDGICTSEIVPFSLYGDIDSDYIVSYLKSPYVDNLINSITYGVKMPRVGTDTMTSLLVPIPPYKEQLRIVKILKDLAGFTNTKIAITSCTLLLHTTPVV